MQSGVAIARRVAAALATGVEAHLQGATAHHRILDQLTSLRSHGADGAPLYAAVTRPPATLLARPETLGALQTLSGDGWRLLFDLLERSTAPAAGTATAADAH